MMLEPNTGRTLKLFSISIYPSIISLFPNAGAIIDW